MRCVGMVAAATAIALCSAGAAQGASLTQLSCAASATGTTGSVTRGPGGATVLSCDYAPDPGYHPSHDGGPWIHIDLLNDSEATLRSVHEGTSGAQMFPGGPLVPPLELVHAYICVSDPWVAWGQCPLDYPNNSGNAGLGYQLNPALIPRLEAGFRRLRAAGLKAILRFTYNYPTNADTAEQSPDAPLNVILQHMQLLAPVLQRNADLIAALQAGFIGKWGEWHQSSSGNDSADAHNTFLDRFRALFSPFTELEVRYPYVLLDYNAHLLGATAPFDVTAVGLGMHNDAFASSPNDEGTFLPEKQDPGMPVPTQYTFQQLMEASAAAGAAFTQTGVVTQIYANQSCPAFPGYAQSLSLSSLNVMFSDPAVMEDWSSSGCLPQILASVGPHLALVSSVWTFGPAGGLVASFTMRNTGWSRLAQARPLLLMLRRPDGFSVSVPVAGSLAEVPPAGDTLTFSATLSGALPEGSYTAFLDAPDHGASLRNDPRYNLLFENLGVPNVRTGLNRVADFDLATP